MRHSTGERRLYFSIGPRPMPGPGGPSRCPGDQYYCPIDPPPSLLAYSQLRDAGERVEYATPRVAGTAPLTAAMAAWTSSFDLLPPRAPAPAEQLFAAGWSAHFVSSIKIMAGKMKSRSGPIWPLTPKPTWAQLAALTFSNLAVWSARSLRRGGRRAPDVS